MVETISQLESKKNLYVEYLQNIGGINITLREADIIACILHNRGEKKIAALLDISHRTVSTHVRNVMNKLGGNSRDNIIDIIEKSGKWCFFKEYYFYLILHSSFIKKLEKVASIINRSGVNYIVDFAKRSEEENSLLNQIKIHLNLANVHIIDSKFNSDKLFFKLSVLHDSISVSNYVEHNIFLLLNNKVNPIILNEIEYIDFTDNKNYYLPVLLLLGELIVKPEMDGIIEEFKSEQLAFEKSFKKNDITVINKEIYHKLPTKLIAIIFTLCVIFSFSIWFFTNNQGTTTQSEVIVETKSQDWNLPPLIGHYTQRPVLTEAIWKKFNQKKPDKNNIAVLAGLHGLGGIGKTTLAKNAIHFPEKEYDFKGWFGAESKNLLQNDYLALGDQYKLFVQDNISIERKIALVKTWMERQRSILLVYDNADDMDILRDYLPNKGDIIITSRNHNIPGAIEIDVMSVEESINLLNNLLPSSLKQHENYKKDVTILVETLGYLPLAISQAGAYINENNITVRDYLSLYSTEKNKLMLDKTMPSMDNHKPAYISWGLSIKKLKEQENGDKALELLNAMSCCYPEHIPKKLLARFLYGNTDNKAIVDLNNLLTLLRKYSMIKTSEDTISLHRLVHDWIAYELDENTLGLDRSSLLPIAPLYEKLCKALNAFMPKVTAENRDNWPIAKTLFPHINIILKLKLEKNTNILQEEALLLNKLGLYYQFIHYEAQKALQHYQEAQNIYNKLGISSVDLAETLVNQGKTLRFMNKLDESLNSFEKALSILDSSIPNELRGAAITGKGIIYSQIKGSASIEVRKCYLEAYDIYKKLHLNQDHPDLANAMHNMAYHYYRSHNIKSALELFNMSLAMYKRLYKGELNLDVAASLNSIGELYWSLGGTENLEKALNYQLQALNTRELLAEGGMNPYLISSYSRIGRTYKDLGNYEKALEVNEKMLAGTYKLYNDYNHVDILGSFQRLAEVQESMGNLNEAMEYYKKSYIFLLRNKYDMSRERDKQVVDWLKRNAPAFVKDPETRIFIKQRSMFSKERYDIKLKIQSKILNKIHDCAIIGRYFNKKDESWFKYEQKEENLGVISYISDVAIQKVYGQLMSKEQLLIAKELCFEAINLGVMSQIPKFGQERDLNCFIEFIKQHTELVEQIAINYPEYFVDGMLLIESARRGVILQEQAKKAIGEEEY